MRIVLPGAQVAGPGAGGDDQPDAGSLCLYEIGSSDAGLAAPGNAQESLGRFLL